MIRSANRGLLPWVAIYMSAADHHLVTNDVVVKGQPAIDCLLEARRLAQEIDCDPWQFALELSCLLGQGISKTQLRGLVHTGLVDHARETTLVGAPERSFVPSSCLQFTKASCFLLTQLGEDSRADLESLGPHQSPEVRESPKSIPRWNPQTRELVFIGRVVKRFRRPAPNQELVLATFEEDQWPARIDDPLPPQAGKDPKRRLHDTINALNKHQRHHLLRFFGDGTGEGLCWEARLAGSA